MPLCAACAQRFSVTTTRRLRSARGASVGHKRRTRQTPWPRLAHAPASPRRDSGPASPRASPTASPSSPKVRGARRRRRAGSQRSPPPKGKAPVGGARRSFNGTETERSSDGGECGTARSAESTDESAASTSRGPQRKRARRRASRACSSRCACPRCATPRWPRRGRAAAMILCGRHAVARRRRRRRRRPGTPRGARQARGRQRRRRRQRPRQFVRRRRRRGEPARGVRGDVRRDERDHGVLEGVNGCDVTPDGRGEDVHTGQRRRRKRGDHAPRAHADPRRAGRARDQPRGAA